MIFSFFNRFQLSAVVIGLMFFASCKTEDVSTIKGEVQNLDTIVGVKLYKQYFDRLDFIAEKKISEKKPTFEFKVGVLDEPTLFQLHVQSKRNNVAILLLDSTEVVELVLDLKNFINYDIKGSRGSQKTQKLTQRLARSIKSLDSLNAIYNSTNIQADKDRVIAEYNQKLEEQREFSANFIWSNLMCRSSVMALYQRYNDSQFVFDRSEDLQLFKAVASSLVAFYPESSYSKGMLNDIQNQKNIISSRHIQDLVRMAEPAVPEIALPNTKGDTVRLSSLRGKVVLLDFWASFSRPNLMENRELLEVYAQFKGRGFEIFQVSLDVEKQPWLLAVESAKLPWINVCELNPEGSYVAKIYNINRIPANYLLDRDFNIVGKNLFGKELVAKLKDII